MKLIVSRIVFLYFCKAVAVGLQPCLEKFPPAATDETVSLDSVSVSSACPPNRFELSNNQCDGLDEAARGSIEGELSKTTSGLQKQMLDKIDEMVIDNGGEYYTNDMLQKAERAIEEGKQRILKESEEQRKREMEALWHYLQGEELEKMRKELARQQNKNARI